MKNINGTVQAPFLSGQSRLSPSVRHSHPHQNRSRLQNNVHRGKLSTPQQPCPPLNSYTKNLYRARSAWAFPVLTSRPNTDLSTSFRVNATMFPSLSTSSTKLLFLLSTNKHCRSVRDMRNSISYLRSKHI